MKFHRYILFGLFVVLTLSQSQYAAGQDVAEKGEQILASHKVPEPHNLDKDSARHALGLVRSKKYKSIAQAKLTDAQRDVLAYNQSAWGPLRRRVAIPVAESTTIVTGFVQAADSNFSENESAIYSEYSFLVDEVLRSLNSPVVHVGDPIICSREGGTIVMPKGNKITWLVPGQGYPKPGERYLLFLKWNDGVRLFEILRAYLFWDNEVYSIDLDAQRRQPFSGELVATFVGNVRAAILAYERR